MKLKFFEPFGPKKPVEIGIDLSSEEELEKLISGLGGEVAVEVKKDGFNAAIHKKADEVKVYTSGKNEFDLGSFPELRHDLALLDDGIYIGEIHGKERGDNYTNKDAFEAMQKRGKGTKIKGLEEKYPLTLSLYDVYNYDGEELLDCTQQERREILEKIAKKKDFENMQLVERFVVSDASGLKKLYGKFVANGKEEGFVIKSPKSKVSIKEKNGEIELKRTEDWVKLKRFSTFDLNLLGFYETENSKEKGLPYSALLLGAYNEEAGAYETVVKVPVNPGREGYYEILEMVDKNLQDYDTEEYDGNIVFSETVHVQKSKAPSKIVEDPSSAPVIQVRAMGVTKSKGSWHSCGRDEEGAYSLRIPVFEHVRHDKEAKDANTTGFIKRYYEGLEGY